MNLISLIGYIWFLGALAFVGAIVCAAAKVLPTSPEPQKTEAEDQLPLSASLRLCGSPILRRMQ